MQLQHEPIGGPRAGLYKGMIQALVHIVRHERARSLWRGNVAGNLLYMLYAPVQFSVFYRLKPMLGGSDGRKPLTALGSLAAGALAGACATLATYPFDLMRTRFAATELGSQSVQRLMPAMIGVVRSSGVAGLYCGLGATLAQIVPAAGIQFALVEGTRGLFAETHYVLPTWAVACAGAGAGVVSKIAVYPLDVAKRRLQMQHVPRAAYFGAPLGSFSGLVDCLVQTAAREGTRALYKGLLPALVKITPASMASFVAFEETMRLLRLVRAGG